MKIAQTQKQLEMKLLTQKKISKGDKQDG